MPLSAIYGSGLEDFIKTHILKAYGQVISKTHDIGHYAELTFLENKNIHPVIIFKNVPFINTEMFKQNVIEIIDKNIIRNPEYKNIKEYLQSNPLYIFNIDEFEYFWLNRHLLSIDSLFLELKESGGQKSLLSIIRATEGTTSKNPLFDGLIQEIFPWGEK
jgi:hypothetical protein